MFHLFSCQACSPGKKSSLEQQTICETCGIDEFSPFSGHNASCLFCPNGYTSVVSSSTCNICPAGKSGTPCSDCFEGKYRGSNDSPTVCIDCLAGFFLSLPGSSTCLSCSPGQYQSEIGSTGCNPCALGRFANVTMQKSCHNCPPGTHQDTTGQASCLPCVPGTFSGTFNNTVCGLCPINTMSNTIKSTYCATCPIGQVTFDKTGQASCQNCIAGRYGATCSECEKGSFRAANNPDSTTCDACPVGQHSDQTGMANCLPCSPGTFNAKPGQEHCEQCVLGQYSLVPNQIKCKFCTDGTGTQRVGSSFCTECAKGKFSNANTNFNCNVCEIGQFGAKEGQQSCEVCYPGLYAPTEEMVACVEAKTDPLRVVAPEKITMEQVVGDPFSIQLNFTHDYEKGSKKEKPDSFIVEWSKSREFGTNDILDTVSVDGGTARSTIVTIDKHVELFLFDADIFIRMKTMKTIDSMPVDSLPSPSTPPWNLAIDCADDEFLNTTHKKLDKWQCVDCPSGAYCRGPTTWNEVRALRGHWQVPWQLDQFERCPFVGDCSGVDPTDGRRKTFGSNGTEKNAGATDGCIVGTTGVLCSSCSPGYNRDANICTQCEDSSLPIRVAVVIAVLLVLLVIFMMIKKRLQTVWRKYHTLYRDVLRIVAIFVTFSQINTSFPAIIEVPWPQFYVNWVSNFGIVNIDLFSVLGVSCVGNFNFYIGFIAMLSLPSFVILYVICSLSSSIKFMNSKVAKMPANEKLTKKEESFRAMYHLLDDDGSGELAPGEFRVLLKMFGWVSTGGCTGGCSLNVF